MRGDPDGPPAVWDIGHVGYREGTSQEICCSGFETQGGYSKLLDAHPEFNPNGRYAADCLHLGTSSFS
jgi:hypothetical protein